jgi:tetratricopeptide (TPR) repeat protein
MRLPDLIELKGALKRLVDGQSSTQDRDQVETVLAGGVLSIASGDRAVAVGGSADGAVVVTGDGNVVLRLDASGATAIERLLQRAFPSRVDQLPSDVADFAGRGAQVDKLLSVLGTLGGRAAIEGMGGLGKTTLAVHVAHCLTDRNPDGQIVLDMAGTSAAPLPPAQAMARVIRAFEPLIQLPEAMAELRSIYLSVLRGRRALLILDNALDGDQVTPLLPPESCALVVTARRRISIASVTRIDLDLLAPDEAIGLLRSIVGDCRATEQEQSGIAELCGFLPLALRVAGMFLISSPHWSAAEFITALADERQRLGRLQLEGSASLDVAASLALSVRELRRAQPDLADRWHELAVFPAGFDTAGAAGVWAQPIEAARDALGRLLSRSMVLYDPVQQRWRLHDLMHDLAAGRAGAEVLPVPTDLEARLTAAGWRHADHYRSVLAAADALYLKGGEHVLPGLTLFDRERRNIENGWAASCARNDSAAMRLRMTYPIAGAYVLELRQHPRQRIAWSEAALAAASEIGDQLGESAALGILGLAYAALGDFHRAIEHYEKRISIARRIGDRRGEGMSLGSLGLAYAALDEHRRAIQPYTQALTIVREIGDERNEGTILGNLGASYGKLGEPQSAIEFNEKRLAIAQKTGDSRSEGVALGNLGIAYAALGMPRRAIEYYLKNLAIAREIGYQRGEGVTLHNLGNAYADLGDRRRAIEFLSKALDVFEAIDSPDAEKVRAAIAKLEKKTLLRWIRGIIFSRYHS